MKYVFHLEVYISIQFHQENLQEVVILLQCRRKKLQIPKFQKLWLSKLKQNYNFQSASLI